MITHALEVSKNSEAGSARAYSVPSIKLADGWPAPSAKWHLLEIRQPIDPRPQNLDTRFPYRRGKTRNKFLYEIF